MTTEDANVITAQIKCDEIKILCVEQHIRQGTSLLLRIVSWYVTADSVCEPLSGMLVSEALELNTFDIISAVADK